MKKFFSDTVAADTIPLKLVVYLGLLAAVLILLVQAWSTAVPFLEDAEIKDQVETAALSVRSIQAGYARNSAEKFSPEGSACTLKLSLPASIRYVSFGVDPDPECNGDLSDSGWELDNNTIIYQYKNGVKKRVFLEGQPIYFVRGELNWEGIWIPAGSQENSENSERLLSLEEKGVIIEDPVSGEFLFEMVIQDGIRYTMSHF